MLAKRIIPCLDVKNGIVVKNVRFFESTWSAGDPADLAARYDASGADEVVFLDISASHEGRKTMLDWVGRAAAQTFIPLTVGGGISSLEQIQQVLRAGADKVSINTAAVNDPALISRGADAFGAQCIVVAIDCKRVGPDHWEVYLHGGRTATGLDAVEWAAEAERRGAGEILLTSMDADGTKDGYDLDVTGRVARAVGIPVIASGGAGTLDHLYDVLTAGRADAALAASIFHSGQYSVIEAKRYLAGKGVAMRLD